MRQECVQAMASPTAHPIIKARPRGGDSALVTRVSRLLLHATGVDSLLKISAWQTEKHQSLFRGMVPTYRFLPYKML